MTYDAESGLDLPGWHHWHDGIDRRINLLDEQGLGRPEPEFDQFAAELAGAFARKLQPQGHLHAMVNFFRHKQTFAGLYNSPGGPAVDRTMTPKMGFCPEMFDRLNKALTLWDTCANPQFASNPVVNKLGMRTYAGAPLFHERTGTVLGTVCVVGNRPLDESTGHASLALIKEYRDAFMVLLSQRADRLASTGPTSAPGTGVGGGRHRTNSLEAAQRSW